MSAQFWLEREPGSPITPELIRTGKKRKVIHRPVRLPTSSLSSPKLTQSKVQAEGRCRLCPETAALTRHHVIPQSWFLGQPEALRQIRNAHANIVPLCRDCHDDVESKHPVILIEARRRLRETFTQQEITFAIQVRGREWLEAQYPML